MSKITVGRRNLLKAGAASFFLSGMPSMGFAKGKPPGSISVIILEGGMDGLATMPPIGDPELMRMRESISPENDLPLNDFFGLHPSLKFYAQLMASGHASAVHATAFPYTRRSHFEGQNFIEGGGLSPFSEKTGWLGRALDLANVAGRSLSLDMPLILRGHHKNDNFYPASIRGSHQPTANLANLIAMGHQMDAAQMFTKVANKSVENMQVPRDPGSLAKYAGQAMAQSNGPVASVIRVGKFDTHANQTEEDNTDAGRLARQLVIVDDVIAGYQQGLGDAWDNAIILTLTEFGRTVAVNGTQGTDHGYASVGLLAGGSLAGSGVLTNWPGLSKKDQFEKRDLMATIDYRSVCAACIEKSMGLDHDVIASQVFRDPNLPRVFEHLFS